MAGETQKTTNLTNAVAKPRILRDSRYKDAKITIGLDSHQFAAATELEAADVLLMDIDIPSNSIVLDISVHNDDMDTDGSPTLALDIGVAAGKDHDSVTSGTVTRHVADSVVDADLFVDGATTCQAATTNWTSLVPDSGTLGPDDRLKPVWELLGFDEDPVTIYKLAVTSATASAGLSAAADFAVKVELIKP